VELEGSGVVIEVEVYSTWYLESIRIDYFPVLL
jgi:hypothetical protein